MNDNRITARFAAHGIRFYPTTGVLSVPVQTITSRFVGACRVLILDVVITDRPQSR